MSDRERMTEGLRDIEAKLSAYWKMKAALESAPDIAFYTSAEFFRLYTDWYEKTRREVFACRM